MPRGRKSQLSLPDGAPKVQAYNHSSEKRTNIPPAKIAGEGEIPKVKRAQYAYNPRLPPALLFDPMGQADQTPASLHGTLEKLALKAAERDEIYQAVSGAVSAHYPLLEWAGKREEHERGFFEVDPVALHIHERASAQACVRMAAREDVQRDLCAGPELPYQEVVRFCRHDVDWANRLILGDSLQVMSSLARRENLASNFQPDVGRRDVKEKKQDLTREPARALLAETGSIFV